MVLIGIMTIFFYFIPAVTVAINGTPQYVNINLFTATFGGAIKIPNYTAEPLPYNLVPCGGLIVGFILGIVGILLTCAKIKVKIANLFALPFYVAAGVLVLCAAPLVTYTNGGIVSFILNYKIIGGAITVGVFFCILAFFALVDFVAMVAKPKQQQPSAY